MTTTKDDAALDREAREIKAVIDPVQGGYG